MWLHPNCAFPYAFNASQVLVVIFISLMPSVHEMFACISYIVCASIRNLLQNACFTSQCLSSIDHLSGFRRNCDGLI